MMDQNISRPLTGNTYGQTPHLTGGFPLIATKLNPPRVARNMLERPRLLARCDTSADWALALVCAGAGFGKTTLLVQWRNLLQAQGYATAWLSLDGEDDSPPNFCRYLLNALFPLLAESAVVPLRELLEEGVSVEQLMAALINTLSVRDQPLYLIVDDYHLIQHALIHDSLAFLLERAPETLHVLLGTRSLPTQLPLNRLRSHNQLIEIKSAELRFDLSEARRYFKEVATLNLSNLQSQWLLTLTEGWITGLQMATLLPAIKENPEQAIQTLGNGTRLLNRYWQEVVFEPLPPAVDDFLVLTSILERLTAELCNAVTRRTDGHLMLEWIEQHNLFLAALDEQGQWFRYHHLFAETLQARLRQRSDVSLIECHERASHWFAQQNLWAEAIRHALAAGRVEGMPECNESGAQSLAEQGDIDTLLHWLQQVPITDDEHRIDLQLNLAWALAHRFRFSESRGLVAGLQQWFQLHPCSSIQHIRLQVIHAICEAFAENVDEALRLVEPLLSALPTGNIWVDGLVCNILSYCHLVQGDLGRAQSVQCHMPAPQTPMENLFVTVYRAFVLGQSYVQQGNLRTGERCFMQAMASVEQLTGSQSIGSATVAALLAELAYEQGDWEHLDRLMGARQAQIDNFAPLDCVKAAYRSLVRRALVEGDESRAQLLIQHARHIAVQRGWERLQAVMLLEQISLQIQRNDLGSAEQSLWQIELLQADDQSFLGCRHYARMAHARLLLARGLNGMAAECLAELVTEFEQRGYRLEGARLRVLWAIALWRMNDPKVAVRALMPALSFGQREGLLRSLLDEGAGVRPILLYCAAFERESTELTAYISTLCDSLGPAELLEEVSSLLSEREQQILHLLAAGLSNKEIARTLHISTETVKWHLKNLYGKLQVTSRTQAMSRAFELSLLS